MAMKKLNFLFLIIVLTSLISSCQWTPLVTVFLNPGQDTVEINSRWVDQGATLLFDGKYYSMTTSDTVDSSLKGLVIITYSYELDKKLYTIPRYVMVVDQTAPEITLIAGNDTLYVGQPWEDSGALVTDNSLEELSYGVQGSVDESTPGTYSILYLTSDSSGNSSSIIRYVDVLPLPTT